MLTANLNPYLEKVSLIRGLDIISAPGHGYGGGSCLGNYLEGVSKSDLLAAGGYETPTIDQVLAYSDRFYETRPALRSLHVGTGSPSSVSYSDYGMPGGAIEQLNQYLNPRDVWDELFMGFMTDGEEPRVDPNISLVNTVYEDFARVRNHRRLGAADRQLLDRHMSFIADIEQGLSSYNAAACVRPEAPPSIENGYPWADSGPIEQFQLSMQLLVDMSVAAIKCDLTRIVTMKIQEGLHDTSGSWEGSYHSSANEPSDWHHYAHNWTDSQYKLDALNNLNRWVCDAVFVRILEGLDVEEADGQTFLDNSLVTWGNELSISHYNINHPTLVAGGAGGALTTGRYLDYTNWNASGGLTRPIPEGLLIPGVPHHRFIVSCLQAMGLRPEDYQRNGDTGYGSPVVGSMPYSWTTEAWDLSKIAEPLPGFLV